MPEYKYVRRKKDGWYASIDGGFTSDKEKAFIFHEDTNLEMQPFLTNEYETLPLTDKEAKHFEQAFTQRYG